MLEVLKKVQDAGRRVVGPAVVAALAGASSAQTPIGPGMITGFEKIGSLQPEYNLALDEADQFGASLDMLWRGDGSSILAVGAMKDDDGGTDSGAVWLIARDAFGVTTGTQKISNVEGGLGNVITPNSAFGRALAWIDDLDGDGIEDLAVGAHWDNDGGAEHGAVWILFLNADMTVKAHQKISDTQGGFLGHLDFRDRFGRSIAYIGDLDGDTVGDIAVGTEDDDGGPNRGAVWIVFLNTDGTVKGFNKISDTQGFPGELLDGDYFGWALGDLSDFNNDGLPDIVATSVHVDAQGGGSGGGSVYLLFLDTDGTVKGYRKVNQVPGAFNQVLMDLDFGYSVARVGDLDGNGAIDIAVGIPLDSEAANESGAVWILMLNANGSVIGNAKIIGAPGMGLGTQDWFGAAVTTGRDLNGDGIGDIVVGARFDDDGALNAGAAYAVLLHGGPVLRFSAEPRAGLPPLSVPFTNESPAQAGDFVWDFGDSGSSMDEDPLHEYTAEGTYTVTLGGTGPTGTSLAVAEQYVAVDELLPGCGANPAGSLTIEDGFPGIGETFTLGIDNPLGSQSVGSFTALFVSVAPNGALPCGAPVPGFGMSAPGANGEFLVGVGPTLIAILFGPLWAGTGIPSEVPIAFPNDPTLVGIDIFYQGLIYDPNFFHYGLTQAIASSIRN